MIKAFTGLLIAVLLLVGGAFLAAGPLSGIIPKSLSSMGQQVRNTQVVEAINREEQIVLLSLGIQGIEERRTPNEKFIGWFEIPSSNTAKFVKYEFKAKLGLEGKDVAILPSGDKEYLVIVPEFIFIGHSDVDLALAAESKGALSWVAPQINDLEIANQILSDNARSKYIRQYEDVLKNQAEAHYRNIVSRIDPAVVLKFEFSD